jgi:hypothetical protein
LDAGAKFLEVGGWVDMTMTGEDLESKAGSKPKLFSVRYMPPPPGSAPAQAAPVQPSYPQQPGSWVAPTRSEVYPPQPPRPPRQPDPWTTTPQAAQWPPAQAQPVWYPQHAPVGYADPTPVSPAHHEQGPPPAWATGGPSAPPAQVSPAPQMSTLAAIRATQAEPANGADQAPF